MYDEKILILVVGLTVISMALFILSIFGLMWVLQNRGKKQFFIAITAGAFCTFINYWIYPVFQENDKVDPFEKLQIEQPLKTETSCHN